MSVITETVVPLCPVCNGHLNAHWRGRQCLKGKDDMSWQLRVRAAIIDLNAALTDKLATVPEHLDDAAANIEAAIDDLDEDEEIEELT